MCVKYHTRSDSGPSLFSIHVQYQVYTSVTLRRINNLGEKPEKNTDCCKGLNKNIPFYCRVFHSKYMKHI